MIKNENNISYKKGQFKWELFTNIRLYLSSKL